MRLFKEKFQREQSLINYAQLCGHFIDKNSLEGWSPMLLFALSALHMVLSSEIDKKTSFIKQNQTKYPFELPQVIREKKKALASALKQCRPKRMILTSKALSEG